MKIKGKVIVVTGGGNGIGREVVLELLRRGARVAAIDIRKESLDETSELAAASDRLMTVPLDITDREAVELLPEQITAALGEPDGLVNDAGIIQPFVDLVDLDYETIDHVLAVNLMGTVQTVKAFLPGLLRRPEAHIVNVSSMGGFLPVPGQTIYGASKAAVKLFTEGLYAELIETNVGVTCALPGAVSTDIAENSGVAAPTEVTGTTRLSPMTPKAAAKQLVDAIRRDRLYAYIGTDSRVLNVASRVAPKTATHLINSQMKELVGR